MHYLKAAVRLGKGAFALSVLLKNGELVRGQNFLAHQAGPDSDHLIGIGAIYF